MSRKRKLRGFFPSLINAGRDGRHNILAFHRSPKPRQTDVEIAVFGCLQVDETIVEIDPLKFKQRLELVSTLLDMSEILSRLVRSQARGHRGVRIRSNEPTQLRPDEHSRTAMEEHPILQRNGRMPSLTRSDSSWVGRSATQYTLAVVVNIDCSLGRNS